MRAFASVVGILALAAAGPAAADSGWSKGLARGLFGDDSRASFDSDSRGNRFGWWHDRDDDNGDRGDGRGHGNGRGHGRGNAHHGHDHGNGHTPGHGGGHCKGHFDDFCPSSP